MAASILIVEDEGIIALDIKNGLINFGYEVAAIVPTAEEAMRKVGELEPDLVLMDIKLQGGQDGIETAQQIRDNFQIPVIYLTAHTDGTTLNRATASSPFGYVLKPFEDRELATAIEIALSRHHTETGIREALEKEQQLNELKSQFFSIVAHEFRNPLSTILLSAELLDKSDRQLSEEKKSACLQRIQSCVKHMNQLLEDFQTSNETSVDTLSFSPTSFNLVAFCHNLVEELQMAHERCQLVFTNQIDSGKTNKSGQENGQSPEAICCLDQRMLRSILTNLLTNAVTYSPVDSQVELNLSRHSQGAIFQIRDQGRGISIGEQSRLMNHPHQVRRNRNPSRKGLGLSIVKQCVEHHQGTIALDSTIGIGTTVTVILPFSDR